MPAPARDFLHTRLGVKEHSSYGVGLGFSGTQLTRFRLHVCKSTAHTISVSGFQGHTPRMERRLETDRGDYSDMISTKVRPTDLSG